ncbi:DUF3135 domain-containing protein [Endothiovibrio diazotrophicus]
MKSASLEKFDFDEWKALAASDPDGFEMRRRQVVEEQIGRLHGGKRQRLQALQWRIDQVRRMAPAPISACYRMYGMMWDTVLREGGLLDFMQRLPDLCIEGGEAMPSPRSAEVLPFPVRHPNRHRH